MNMRELAKDVSQDTGLPQATVKVVLGSAFEAIAMRMPVEPVKIPGFATFYTKDVKERVRRNPFTGGEIVCPAHKKPKVRFSKRFKDYLK